ncbi:aldehyde dehydrogenase (NADP(+)) [Cognatishimia sp. D5M38]|uniref:Aldehyde dehydrogenase (NADP(+)) n=1 Tax=Cognatishimia coralii TaxID=3083254 RepID=A0ABU8QIJ7_9RHOB
MLQKKHLIAGDWVDAEERFENQPVTGDADSFAAGTQMHVDQAVRAAEDTFWSFGYSTRDARAAFLRKIADEIEARGAEITAMGVKETGLPEARLEGERGRTTGQLRYFADAIETGDYLDRTHDAALPDRAPLPRPDLRLMQRPIGPVAVFGASNFPLAFSTAGGDTAAALAAGCPVVVRGHHAHPGVSDLVAQAIDAAIKACDMPAGVLSLIQGGPLEVGAALVQHPLIKAVGFTGSLKGGRALFDLCAARPEPIPFFGELGSVNPMFLLPELLATKAKATAEGWAASLTMGAGQFCTNPGVVVMIASEGADAFLDAAQTALGGVAPQVMLTDGIGQAYQAGQARISDKPQVTSLIAPELAARSAAPSLARVSASDWLADDTLADEVFGPFGLAVICENEGDMRAVAKSLHGQLTCTLHLETGDEALAQSLMPILEHKAGRVLANGFPTGVEVCDAMMHGGPYPASTTFGATSVGAMSIRRFLKAVSYQNLPEALIPQDLR